MTVDVRIRRCRIRIAARTGWSAGAGGQPHVDAALAGIEAALDAAIVEAGIAPDADARVEAPVRLVIGSDGTTTQESWTALVEALRAAPARPPGAVAPVAGGDAHAAGAGFAGWAPEVGEAPEIAPPASGGAPLELGPPAGEDPAREPVAGEPGSIGGPPTALDAGPLPHGGPRYADTRAGASGGPSLDDTAGGAATADRAAGAARPAGGAGRSAGAGDAGPSSPAVSGALGRTIARWSRDGRMVAIVGGWPPDLVHDWLAAIDVAGAWSGSPPMTEQAVGRIADAVLDGLAAHADAERLLIVLAAMAAALGERLPDRPTQAHARALTAAGSGRASDLGPAGGVAPVAAQRSAAARAAGARPRPALPTEQVVPALPFIALAQLARIGYVDAIVAAVAAAGLTGGDGALGAALAAKTLPAPGPAGRREPAEDAALAFAANLLPAPGPGGRREPAEDAALAFAANLLPAPGPAGRREPAEDAALAFAGAGGLDEDGMAALVAQERALVVPLASALQSAYAGGRGTSDEVLVTVAAEGIVCGEEHGLLPAAWVASEAELDGVLASLGRPPARRDDAFAALARALHARPGVPDAPALERHLGAAAGTALGLIAMTLWGQAEPATPLLALERLGDLEALVRAGDDGLVVAIPRGRRWLELQRAGMLDLFTIPWLPGGRMELSTW